MKLALALVLNLVLLAGLASWLRTEYRRVSPGLRCWLVPTLALRLVVGGLPHGPDSRLMSYWGQALTAQFWARPGAAWAFWQGHEMRDGIAVLKMYEWSNTLFTIKLLGVLNLLSLSNQWLNSCYFSIGGFVGCWVLVRTLARLFPTAPVGAGVVAFLLWPSAVWWASGITKEALVLGSGAALTALFLRELYLCTNLPRRVWSGVGTWLMLALLAWVNLRLRYFFALPLLGSLLALAMVVLAQRRGWLRGSWPQLALALLGGLVLAGTVVVLAGGEPVSQRFVTSQLWQNYGHGIGTSAGRPHIEYAGLRATVGSMGAHFPLAAFQALARPWLGESALPLYLAAGLENLLLLLLMLVAGGAVVRGHPGRLPAALVLALLLYCLVLAGLIGLSTPNLGTLHRYRTVLLPWLLWLLLQNDYARRLLRRCGLGG